MAFSLFFRVRSASRLLPRVIWLAWEFNWDATCLSQYQAVLRVQITSCTVGSLAGAELKKHAAEVQRFERRNWLSYLCDRIFWCVGENRRCVYLADIGRRTACIRHSRAEVDCLQRISWLFSVEMLPVSTGHRHCNVTDN